MTSRMVRMLAQKPENSPQEGNPNHVRMTLTPVPPHATALAAKGGTM
jgi:hypothetical protein